MAEFTGETPLDTLGRDGIKRLVEYLQHRDLDDSTANAYNVVIRLFFAWLTTRTA